MPIIFILSMLVRSETIPTNLSDPKQYRPISLLSCVGKILESLLLQRLTNFEKENQIFIKEQFGFRNQHSTVQQVLRITERASFGFNKNLTTGLVLLDLEKAFDSVWHDGLVYKLSKFKHPKYLIKIILSYLQDRKAFVTFND